MAEAVALGASVVAFIQLSDRLIQTAKFYIEAIKDCPADIRAILVEVSSLKAVLQTLDFVLANDIAPGTCLLGQLVGEHGPVEECRKSLSDLERLLPRDFKTASGKRRKILNTAEYLAWPLKQTSARKLLDNISRYKATITFALTHDASKDVKGLKKDMIHIKETLTQDHQARVFTWLEGTNPSEDHNKALKLREDHTGLWVLRLAEWKDWISGKEKFLWFHGIPGAGKTVLASFLIEQAQDFCRQRELSPGHQKPTVAVYYYCYFARNQDEAVPCLRWIVSQLCRQSGWMPSEIERLFQLQHLPSLSQLLLALELILKDFEAVFFIVDAVDESQSRLDLLRTLRDLATDHRFDKIRLLATSREYYDIETCFSGISRQVSMDSPMVRDDIRRYVHSSLLSNKRFQSWPQTLAIEVEEALAKGAKGMFRWAVCQLDVLQRLGRQSEIRNAIRNLPRSLEETYERIFQLIPEEARQVVQSALLVICGNNDFRLKPIPSNILLSVINFRLSGDEIEDVTFYDRDTLRDYCGCLISLTMHNDMVLKDTERVSLAHYTVKEYLYSDRIIQSPVSFFALSSELVWAELFRMAVAINGGSQTTPPTQNSKPFYSYLMAFSWVYLRRKRLEKTSQTMRQ